MRILILGGAGLMSAGTVRDLLSPLSMGIERIVAADSNSERLAALGRAISDTRLVTRTMNITDRISLTSLLADCDLCINGVPTFAGYQMDIFDACLEAGRTYVDYGGMGEYTIRQKARHEAWRDAGVTAVIGLGADPGLSNVICRAVADRLDRIERINLYWAATKVGPESPVLVPPYSLSTILAEYANPSRQFLDGRLQEAPPRGGVETVELPEPWGRTTFMYSQHSEPLTIPFSKGIAEKGIREFTWKLSLPEREHEAWTGLVKAGFTASDDTLTVQGVPIRPLQVLQAVIDRNIEQNRSKIPVQESHEIHIAIGHGEIGGRPHRVTCRMISHPDPLYDGYADAATSMCMSVGVQQILARPLNPGVWAPEEYFEPGPFFAGLRKRHFLIEQEAEELQPVS